MMRFLFSLVLILATLPHPALAQRSDSIAAVVNNDVITYTDVYDRIDMVIKSSGMPNNREFREKLLPQVLTGLITERIQIQEANRLGLKTSDEEIADGFNRIAAQNNMTPEQFKSILKRQNVNIATIEGQILSQIAWGKVVQREIRPRIRLGDDDINTELRRLQAKTGETEYLVAEIFIPLGDKGDEKKTRAAATDLSKQLLKDIQKFPAAARQFSQNASAATGGIIGWVTPDQLDPDLAIALGNMDVGKISDPIRTADGYYILFLRDSRVINIATNTDSVQKLRIKMAVIKLADDETTRRAQTTAAETFTRDVAGCLDIVKRTAQNKDMRLDEIYDTADHIPSDILNAVSSLSIGEAAKPIESAGNLVIPMLCGRDGGGSGTAALEQEIETRIGTQRLDILQRRYLRDLIADAYIERRV